MRHTRGEKEKNYMSKKQSTTHKKTATKNTGFFAWLHGLFCFKKSVGKIYKTTDGNLRGDKTNTKSRSVIAIQQRRSDGAVAVTKVHSKKGRNPSDRSKYIQGVELTPKKHPALKEPSIVEKRAIFGQKEGKTYTPLYPQKMRETGDKLKGKELRKVRKGIQNDTKDHRKTYKKTVKRWKKRFKK